MSSEKKTADGHAHAHPNYVKVWAILLVLLVVSVTGPMIGIPAVTLITAFGIAIVKAYLVAKNFMHLDLEPKYIGYLLATCVTFMLLMFAGVAPDVMKHSGQRWTNVAAQAEVERALSRAGGGGGAPAAPASPEVAFRTTCAPCHGTAGDGSGPAAASLDPRPANFTSAEFWATRDRDHVARVIRNGGASVGRSALMPSFGAQFDPEHATALADYIVATFRPDVPSAVDGGAAPLATDGGEPTPDAGTN